jgi:hypothetical protein
VSGLDPAKPQEKGQIVTKRLILADLSDTHGGHRLGLLNPETTCYDETENGQLVPYTPKLTASQVYLWELYQQNIEYVQRLAGEDEIILLHNGDLAQGNKYPQQLVSDRMADQIEIAVKNLEPWFALPGLEKVRIVAGTGSHNFQQASAEIIVATSLQRQYAGHDIKMLYHGLADIDGLGVDYAHHGPFPGSRKWLKGNEARYYLRSIMMDDIMSGKTPPRLVLRAHYHEWIKETLEITVGNKTYESTLVITPSFCMVGDYAMQAVRSPNGITNGMAAFEIVDGELIRVHRLTKSLDIRTRETL